MPKAMFKVPGLTNFRHVALLACTAAAVALLFLAADRTGDTSREGAHRLVGALDSSALLARAFLEALKAGDEEAIRAMTLSREEFAELVWPELPASNPRTNLTVDFVWEQMHLRSRAAAAATYSRNKGRDLKLVSLRYTGREDRYPGFTIHQDPLLTVRAENGEQEEIALFGSVIERNGKFKVFSFSL